MLNRRHLRIKALQTLYAYYQAEAKDMRAFEKNLLTNIQKVNEFYVYLLQLGVELAGFEENDVKEKPTKHRPTQDDLSARAVLASNYFIQLLQENTEFLGQVNKYKSSFSAEAVLLRELYNKLKATDEYKAYAAVVEHTEKEDQDFMLFVFKKVIFKLPLLEQHMEELHINWPVDVDAVESMVIKTVKTFKKDGGHEQRLMELTTSWVEDRDYIVELFQKTILNNDKYGEMIAAKTQNWDMDRLAMIDTILMKMAIAEMIHFPSIPIKVTMNEYIDISKEFSTPNSKTFINGILDKVLGDLKKDNMIRKTGRGLLE